MKTIEKTKMRNLPILRHFDETSIATVTDAMSFRKGEKPMFNLLKLILVGAVGYFSWVYVLPPLFQAIGSILATAGSIVLVVALILMAPVIFKGLRRLTRILHKSVIRHDPFGELEDQKNKMQANKRKFQMAKGKIAALKTDMEIEAQNSQESAEKLSNKISALHAKATKLKTNLELLEKQHGVKAKGMDEYINDHMELMKIISEANRKSHEYEQQKDFIQKYGSRAAIMKKFNNKLLLVETSMDIKILDFDATIEILKKDYEFAQKSREATQSAKDAMLFTKGWELEYALDVVTSTIAQDIAITAGNLKDIDTLTSTYSMDQDELYSSLDTLAERINTGADVIPTAKSYSAIDYQPTHEDKIKSGGFGEMF